MGSRLALLATLQLIAAAALTGDALADRARDLYKRGIDEYKTQKYAQAASTLAAAYELDPKPETLFALAQAERLAERCDDARAHYKKLLEATTEIATARAVQSNLELCGPDPAALPARRPEPDKPAPAPAPPPPPRTITRTVVREVRRSDKLATLLVASGMLGLGAGGGLYLAARDSRRDADRAATLDDHDRLYDRADTERIAALAAAGAGAALIGAAVVRWATAGSAKATEPGPDVALAPSATGAMVVLSAGW